MDLGTKKRRLNGEMEVVKFGEQPNSCTTYSANVLLSSQVTLYESCWSPYIELHRAIWHDIAEQMRETDVGKCKFAPPFMTEWVLF